MSLTGEQHISKTINLLRFPLMLLVVCMHFSGGGDNTTLLYCNLMQFGLIYFSTAVPIYFAISGYLFWKGNDLFQYKNKIQKRVYSLIIPYLLWNLLFIVAYCLLNMNFSFQTLYGFVNINANTFNDFMVSVFTGKGMPANYPLRYLRDLIVCSLLSPLLYLGVKRLPWVTLILLFIGWCLTEGANGRTYLTGLCWFALGMAVKVHNVNITVLKSYCLPLCVISLILALLMPGVYLKLITSYSFYHVLLTIHIAAVLSLSFWVTASTEIQVPKLLSESTFWIYVSHAFVQLAILKMEGYIGLPMTDAILIMLFVVNVSIVTAFCVMTYFIFKKYIPQLTSLLTGNRI